MVLVPGAGDERERDAGVAAARVDRPAVADVHVDVVDRPVVVAVVEEEIAGADLVPADLPSGRRHRRRGPLRQRPSPKPAGVRGGSAPPAYPRGGVLSPPSTASSNAHQIQPEQSNPPTGWDPQQ